MTASPLVQLRGVTRSYGGVVALQNLSLEILPGEVHALCGENGAGKSTLIRVLAGIVAPDEGDVLVQGGVLEPGRVRRSEEAGIAVMHQESTAFPDLNAVDNVFVGRELTWARGLLLDRRAMIHRTQQLLERLGERIPLNVPIGRLPLAQRQMVGLARALSRDCRLMIMDEPTASLSHRETRTLLRVIRQLREEAISVLFVSHRLEEVFEIADRVTVLRDGHLVATRAISDVTKSELIHLMVGREVTANARHTAAADGAGEVVLEVSRLTRAPVFQDISFSVRAGEIVGLAGLVGAGRSEIARAVFGIDDYDTGQVRVGGKPLPAGSTRRAMDAGIGLVPEDRQHEGLILPMTVAANISLVVLPQLTAAGVISRLRERAVVAEQILSLDVRCPDQNAAAATLSGGNQQKLVLAKWLAANPRVLILDEPTRGVDVGARAQVHQLIHQLARTGLATLLISSDLPEVLALCDRVLVIRDGRIAGELSGSTATQEQVLELALPASQAKPTGIG